jgi:hypothetical protein
VSAYLIALANGAFLEVLVSCCISQASRSLNIGLAYS